MERNIPVLIGTAGGAGANPHLEWNLEIIKELAKEYNWHFKMAVIPAEIEKEIILEELKKGTISSLHPAPEITIKDIEESTYIVAQMGVKPLIKALDAGYTNNSYRSLL